MRQDAKGFGLDTSDWEDDDDDGVWPDHHASFLAFLCVASQWRAAPLASGPVWYWGLDYAACDAGWRRAGIEVTPEIFDEVQIIEAGARQALNEVY